MLLTPLAAVPAVSVPMFVAVPQSRLLIEPCGEETSLRQRTEPPSARFTAVILAEPLFIVNPFAFVELTELLQIKPLIVVPVIEPLVRLRAPAAVNLSWASNAPSKLLLIQVERSKSNSVLVGIR